MDTEFSIDLTGRIALVTGATRRIGIGAAICRIFARHGANIAFTSWTAYDREAYGTTDHDAVGLEAELRALGVEARRYEVDLSDPETPTALIEAVIADLGPLSILVNNAAVSFHDDATSLTADSLDRHYAVNVRAAALLSVAFAQRFTTGRGGRIINLTSGQGVAPMPSELSYATTKGALEILTTSFAAGVAAKGITVNAIDPGGTDTGWMSDDVKATIIRNSAFGRIGLPDDAARLALFLASDAGEWITGQILRSRGA